MASVEYQNSILWRGQDPLKAKFAPSRDATKKVVRYFPGKAPRWAPGDDKKPKDGKGDGDEEEELDLKEARASRKARRQRHEAAVVVEQGQGEDAGSSRLKRLRAQAASASEVVDASDRLRRRRLMHEAQVLENAADAKDSDDEVLKKKEEEDDIGPLKKEEPGEDHRQPVAELQLPMDLDMGGEEDDEELKELRREKMRAAALQKRKQEEELIKDEPGGEDEEDEADSSSYESDSDDPRRALMKPVFVSKTQRETVKEREAQLKEQEAADAREKERQAAKKVESKSLVCDTIRADDEAEAAGVNDENDMSDIELIDDDDEKNEAEEYELWKIRELKRIKRDKEERLERQQELELIERRRRMTDAEREADDAKMDDGAAKRDEVKQFSFLQKYYHRGTFFQDKAATGEEPLYNRDYHEPTAEETFDKQLLPKAMQVRRGLFGKKGQVKHTHLTDVDTTDMSAAWSQHSKNVQKYQEKMAGAKGVNNFERPQGARSSGD